MINSSTENTEIRRSISSVVLAGATLCSCVMISHNPTLYLAIPVALMVISFLGLIKKTDIEILNTKLHSLQQQLGSASPEQKNHLNNEIKKLQIQQALKTAERAPLSLDDKDLKILKLKYSYFSTKSELTNPNHTADQKTVQSLNVKLEKIAFKALKLPPFFEKKSIIEEQIQKLKGNQNLLSQKLRPDTPANETLNLITELATLDRKIEQLELELKKIY